jgi:hypothetical protein
MVGVWSGDGASPIGAGLTPDGQTGDEGRVAHFQVASYASPINETAILAVHGEYTGRPAGCKGDPGDPCQPTFTYQGATDYYVAAVNVVASPALLANGAFAQPDPHIPFGMMATCTVASPVTATTGYTAAANWSCFGAPAPKWPSTWPSPGGTIQTTLVSDASLPLPLGISPGATAMHVRTSTNFAGIAASFPAQTGVLSSAFVLVNSGAAVVHDAVDGSSFGTDRLIGRTPTWQHVNVLGGPAAILEIAGFSGSNTGADFYVEFAQVQAF